jgi:hypothetical protein
VNDVGEPCAGEPRARFDAAAGGAQRQSALLCGAASRRPYRLLDKAVCGGVLAVVSPGDCARMVTISTDPPIIVFSSDDLESPAVDINVDVEVHTEAGRWSASFFTLANIESLITRYAATGECAGGLYLWAADMIVVRELSYEVIRRTVAQLQRDGEFESAFGLLED